MIICLSQSWQILVQQDPVPPPGGARGTIDEWESSQVESKSGPKNIPSRSRMCRLEMRVKEIQHKQRPFEKKKKKKEVVTWKDCSELILKDNFSN